MTKALYQLDDQTREYMEVALNCVVSIADSQVDDVSHQGLIAIAEQLSDAFGIPRYEAEIHKTDDGTDELIYRPPTGLFREDQDEQEDEDE